jgi:hypothetical protein
VSPALKVAVATQVVHARASCATCDFDLSGGNAPAEATKHVEETGHRVFLNSNTFAIIEREPDDPVG